jgi:photosystem II stability/assembly factor-like uncharacterized protein
MFIDTLTGWVVGYDGIIMHTTDGGQSWHTQPTTGSWNLLSVWAVDGHTAWASGMGGTIIHTSNGSR